MRTTATPSIAIVTAAKMPKPDLEIAALTVDLECAGYSVAVVPWDGDVPWAQFDLIFVKSTWDYFTRLAEFLDWAKQISELSTLQNPYAVIEWNADKRYLQALDNARVPIIPTSFVAPNTSDSDIFTILRRFGSDEIVIKPAISIGAFGALRITASDPLALKHIRHIEKEGHVLVQPFIASVLSEGEVSLIYFDGRFSHAVRKRPSAGEYRVQDHHGGTVHRHIPDAEELAVAESSLAVAPQATLIARIDLVTIGGRPHVIELELIEPALFLSAEPAATANLLAAIRGRIPA